SLLASIVTTILLASAHLEAKMDVEVALLHPAYLFLGSLALGGAVASAARLVARTVEKTKDLHFTLIAGMVIGAVGLAIMLKLSVILALLAFGLFSRNDARSHDLLNVNLGASSRLLYVVLFVITGASLPVTSLVVAGGAGGPEDRRRNRARRRRRHDDGPPHRAHSRRAGRVSLDAAAVHGFAAALAGRGAGAHGAEHARLQPRARRAGSPRPAREGGP